MALVNEKKEREIQQQELWKVSEEPSAFLTLPKRSKGRPAAHCGTRERAGRASSVLSRSRNAACGAG